MKKNNKNINKEIIFHFVSLFIKSFLLIIILCTIVAQLSTRVITPINLNGRDRIEVVENQIQSLPNIHISSKKEINDLSRSICVASDVTNIKESLLISIAYEESRMNKNAKSTAGYRGYMQATTKDIFEFAEVDVMRGAKKLQRWIDYRNGNLRYALASYNGGTYPPQSSYDYADKIIKLARKIDT